MSSFTLSRRHLLLGMGAAPFVGACEVAGAALPGPRTEPLPPWAAPGALDEDAFAWGVIVGDARSDGGLVSVKTLEPSIALVVMAEGALDWEEIVREDVEVVDGTARFSLRGLAADARYAIAAFAGDASRRSQVTAFKTAPAPGTSRTIRFAASSCFGGNAPWPSLSHVAERELDFFCLLGDLVYADNVPNAQIAALYSVALSTKGMRDVIARMPIVATWDDHEVQNNWSYAQAGLAERVEVATAAFHNAIPIEDGLGEKGIYRSLRWGSALELFVLDSRGERRDGRYLSIAQMDWFKAALSASTARFKIVCNSVPMTNLADTVVGQIEANDRWQGYPEQRNEILNHIGSDGITGVFWISGDFHLGSLGRVDSPGGPAESQFEVLCGPAGSPINQAIGFIEPTERIPIIVGQHNCVVFECDPEAGTIAVQFIGDDNNVIAESKIDVT